LWLPVVVLEDLGTVAVVVPEDSIVLITFLFRTAVTQLPLARGELEPQTVLPRKLQEETQSLLEQPWLVEAEVQAPTGLPQPVALVEDQITTARELQVRLVRDTKEAGVAQRMHGQVVVVVEPLAPVEALLVHTLAARVETAFNSPSEASPTTQQLEVVERANGEEERLVPTLPEEE
jgi:hypothetical protein